MNEDTKRALLMRLNWILAHIQENKLQSAEREIGELISEVKGGIVAPF